MMADTDKRRGKNCSQNLHKIISTHLLTVLIISAIVHIEQRKGNNKEAS